MTPQQIILGAVVYGGVALANDLCATGSASVLPTLSSNVASALA